MQRMLDRDTQCWAPNAENRAVPPTPTFTPATLRPQPPAPRLKTSPKRTLAWALAGLGVGAVGMGWSWHTVSDSIQAWTWAGATLLWSGAMLGWQWRQAEIHQRILQAALDDTHHQHRLTRHLMHTACQELAHSATALASDSLLISHRTEAQNDGLQQLRQTLDTLQPPVERCAAELPLAHDIVTETTFITDYGRRQAQTLTDQLADMQHLQAQRQYTQQQVEAWLNQLNQLALQTAIAAARQGESGQELSQLGALLRDQVLQGDHLRQDLQALNQATPQVAQWQSLAESALTALQDVERATPQLASTLHLLSQTQDQLRQGLRRADHTVQHLDQAYQDTAVLSEQSSQWARQLQTHSQAWQLRAGGTGSNDQATA